MMPLLETSCCPLWFADQRRENQIPLLLIHGAGGTHLDWSAPLRKMGALVPDLPGHGKSPAPGFQTVSDYARAMIALLDALSIPQVTLVGHSMGGAIAQMMALDTPERIHRLILIATAAKLPVSPQILDRVIDHQEEVALMLKTWLWSENADPRWRENTFKQFMAFDPHIIHGDYLACNSFDIRPRLGEIQAPTLVIGAGEDKMTPHKFSGFLAENIPNAELATVQGAGHMVIIEQPETVGEAVRSWLAHH